MAHSRVMAPPSSVGFRTGKHGIGQADGIEGNPVHELRGLSLRNMFSSTMYVVRYLVTLITITAAADF